MKKTARLPGWFFRLLSFVPVVNLIAIIYLGVVAKHVFTLMFGIIYLIAFFASAEAAAILSLLAIPYYFFAYRYLKKKIGKSDAIESTDEKNRRGLSDEFQGNDRNLSEIQALKEEINTLKIALGEVEGKIKNENTSLKEKNEENHSSPQSEPSVNEVDLSLTDDVETESQAISPLIMQENEKLMETFIQAEKPLSDSLEVSKDEESSESDEVDFKEVELTAKKTYVEVESSSNRDRTTTLVEENLDNKLTETESDDKQSNLLSTEEKTKPDNREEFEQRNKSSLDEEETPEKIGKTEPDASLARSIETEKLGYFDAIRMAEALGDEPALEWQTKDSELTSTQLQFKEDEIEKGLVENEGRSTDVSTQEPFIVEELNEELDEVNQPGKSELMDKNINLVSQRFEEVSTNVEKQTDLTEEIDSNSSERINLSSLEVLNENTALTSLDNKSKMFNAEAKNQSLNSDFEKLEQKPLYRREQGTNNSANTNSATEKIKDWHWDAESSEKGAKTLDREISKSGLSEFHRNSSKDSHERKNTLQLDLDTIRSLRDESEAVREALLVEQEESKPPLTDLRDMTKVYQTLSPEAKTLLGNLHKSNWRVPLEMRNEKIVNEINRQSEYLVARSILVLSRGWIRLEEDLRDEFQEILLDETLKSKRQEAESTGKNGSIFDLHYLPQPLKSLIEKLAMTDQETVRIILESKDIEKDLRNFAEQNLSMPETLIDNVNEKAMLLMEDILIDTSGVPQILEEYYESLRNSMDRSM